MGSRRIKVGENTEALKKLASRGARELTYGEMHQVHEQLSSLGLFHLDATSAQAHALMLCANS